MRSAAKTAAAAGSGSQHITMMRSRRPRRRPLCFLSLLAAAACSAVALLQFVCPLWAPTALTHQPMTSSLEGGPVTEAKMSSRTESATVVQRKQMTKSPILEKPHGHSFPKVLHQFYAADSVPEVYLKYILSCVAVLNYSYVLWTDADVLKLIDDHYGELRGTYLSYKLPLQRSDFGRYVVMRHYGGVYMDMDVECMRPLEPLIKQSGGCFLDRERWEQTAILYNRPVAVMNSVMGCTPGHPFFDYLVRALLSYPRRDGQYSEIVRSTGPLALTDILQRFRASNSSHQSPAVTVLPSDAFSPYIDNLERFRGHCERYRSLQPHLGPSGQKELALKFKACDSLRVRDFIENPSEQPLVLMRGTYGAHRFLHVGYQTERRGRLVPLAAKLHGNSVQVLRYSTNSRAIDSLVAD